MFRLFKYVLADLNQQKRFCVLFLLGLSLGLTGLVTIDSFRHNIEQSLQKKSRNVLGADVGMSARHPISSEQKEQVLAEIGKSSEKSEMTELYSMVASLSGDSRLIQIKAIDGKYPFYGEVALGSKENRSDGQLYDINKDLKVWVYPEVLVQLGVEVGDKLKIGRAEFVITDTVEDDSGSGFSTSMAPRIYIGLEQLDATALLQEGSIAWYSTLFRTDIQSIGALEGAVAQVFENKSFPETVRVYTHKDASEMMGRLLGYLNDYLSLVSIVAIFLASIGISFLYRSYISSKVREVAILNSLGLGFWRTILLYIAQVTVLGALAGLLTVVFSFALIPALSEIVQDLLAVEVSATIPVQSLLVAFGLAVLGSSLISLPILLQLEKVKPVTLLGDPAAQKLKRSPKSLAAVVLGVVAIYALSVWKSNSWIAGSTFFFGVLFSALLLGGLATLAFSLFNRYGSKFAMVWKLALRNLSRQPRMSLSCFLALALGMALINVIPQLEASLQTELEQPDQSQLPSFFLFDIQEDQVDPLKAVLTENGAQLTSVSPMIRARLTEVNGEPFETDNANEEKFSREAQREARFRNRGFNLSYRNGLFESEKIIDGKPIMGDFDPTTGQPAEISLETRFAKRLGLKMGDLLTFDVQSIPVSGKVVNIRSVRWTTFQPNFFIQFQPGILEPAPKTFIATIADLPLNQKNLVQNAVVKALPNVSLIDVTRMVERISNVSQQMSVAMQAMALLCLIVGFFVLYSIATHQARSRGRDVNLFKVLGASFGVIRRVFVLEFLVLGVMAGLTGLGLSVLVSYLLSSVLFESLWVWDPMIPLVSFAALLIGIAALSAISLQRVLRARARSYF